MIKPSSDFCPCECDYCYYHDPEKGRAKFERMELPVLEQYIKQFIELGCPEPLMSWQGGEPTMAGLDFFQQAVAWQKEYARGGQFVRNAFQTCGILLDDDWCTFLGEEKFLVGLSIDGPQDLHDSIRRDRGGKPTWERAVAAYHLLRKHKVETNILCVISKKSVGRAGDIYRALREIGSDFLQFIPCGPGREGSGNPELMVTGADYGQFLVDLMDAWIAEGDPGIYMRTNDNLLHLYFGVPCEFCQFTRGCLSMVTAEADGTLYPCDFFVEDEFCLGRIQETPLREMVFNETHLRFFRDTQKLHRSCRDCGLFRFCHGGCLRQRGVKPGQKGRDAKGRNLVCDSMKLYIPAAFERFDALLAGQIQSAPQMTQFMRNLVQRFGWPRESKLTPPPGVKPVAGGVPLHKKAPKKSKSKKRR